MKLSVHRTAMLLLPMLLISNTLLAGEAADSWIATRLQYNSFEATGQFTTHNQFNEEPLVSFFGTFRWVTDGDRFFCDIQMDEDCNHRDYRYTCLRDNERTAVCVCSEKLSKGCEIKISNNITKAYRNQFSFFPVRLERGLEYFFPRIVLSALEEDTELENGVRGECHSGKIRSEFTLDPDARNLISTLVSYFNDEVVARQSFKFDVNSEGIVVPKRFTRVSGTPGKGGFTDQELTFDSFSLGTNGFAFAFADLEPCGSVRMIDQTGDGIQYARVIEPPSPKQSIRKSFEANKEATAEKFGPVGNHKGDLHGRGLMLALSAFLFLATGLLIALRKKPEA